MEVIKWTIIILLVGFALVVWAFVAQQKKNNS